MLLYIDPGTGSMLFTVLIGVVGVGIFFLRSSIMKIKYVLSLGKIDADKSTYKFAIFADHKRYWSTFEPICDEFEKRGLEIAYFTASEDDPALQKGYKYVKCIFAGKGNATYAKLNFLNADIVLSTTPNLDVYQWKRSKSVKYYVHIFHAVGDPMLYHMFSLDAYDAILNTNSTFDAQIRRLEALRNQPPKEIVEAGLPYLDRLLEIKKKAPVVKNDKPVVLLSPSWKENAILSRYGEDFIRALVDTGYYIIIRPHPQSFVSERELIDSLMAKFPAGENLEWNTDNDNFDVLNRSDIMISDYSGIIFDYSLVFNKPVIYAEFEYVDPKSDYYWIQDEEIWLLEAIKKYCTPFGTDYKDKLKGLIDASLNDKGRFEAYEAARKEGWAHIGESAKITADYLIAKQAELTRKPATKAEKNPSKSKNVKQKKSAKTLKGGTK